MKKFASLLMAALLMVAMALPASAAVDFAASVEQKPAPSVETVTDASGNEVSAIIQDASGNEVARRDRGPDVHHPRVRRWPAPPPRFGSSWKPPTSRSRTPPPWPTWCPMWTWPVPALQTMGSSSSVEDLVVRDVFDVSVSGEAAEFLAQEGNAITIRFQLNIAPSSTLLVLHNYEGSNWEVIDDDKVVINNDGSVDVTFDSLSPVAFVVDQTETDTSASTDDDAPTSPQTGDSGLPPVAGAGLIALGTASPSSPLWWFGRSAPQN